jgi:hypothetical protein
MKKTILLFSLLILGCKSLKKVQYKSNLKKITTKTLINEIKNREPQYDFLSIRSQSTITENTSITQFNLGIRIQKDKKILINGSILIPIFKALLTNKNASFYEKISRTYYKGGYTYLSDKLNYEFNLNNFQNMLTGQPVISLAGKKWRQQETNENYALEFNSKKNNINVLYMFNPIDLSLIRQEISSNNSKLIVEYEQYQKVEGSLLPQKVKILVKSEAKELKILLDLKMNKKGNSDIFFFQIPKGYKEVKL